MKWTCVENWTCIEEELSPGYWRVEEAEKGYVAVFSGRGAQERAEEYAAVQNAKARWQQQQLFLSERVRRSILSV